MIRVPLSTFYCAALLLIGLCAQNGRIHSNPPTDSLSYFAESPKDFIIRWAFWTLCHCGYDPRPEPESAYLLPLAACPRLSAMKPEEVQPGDRIFLKGRYAHEFFKKIVPQITVPFILVSHGEFRDAFCEEYIAYLEDPRLIAWFGIHPCDIKHPKFHPIPLGVWAYLPRAADRSFNADIFQQLRAKSKSKLLYMNFAEWTHPERKLLIDLFGHKDYCTFNTRVPFEEYVQEMAQHKFTLSPRGLGPDCYRTWEALMVGSIPIVKRSYLDEMYEGLPVLIVDSWDELNEEMLLETYEKMKTVLFKGEKLSIEYWDRKMELIRDDYFRKDTKELT